MSVSVWQDLKNREMGRLWQDTCTTHKVTDASNYTQYGNIFSHCCLFLAINRVVGHCFTQGWKPQLETEANTEESQSAAKCWLQNICGYSSHYEKCHLLTRNGKSIFFSLVILLSISVFDSLISELVGVLWIITP